MKIEIDSGSGFCFGVVSAIERAEEELKNNKTLYCLGDIVHNSVEVRRLEERGLKTISYEEFNKLHDCKVLIRAHGEPPQTYQTAQQNNIELIDASCPVVLQLQKRIKEGYQREQERNGQIVIYGTKGHAEVNGLVGQTNDNALVISSPEEIEKIDFSRPVTIFSQTTKSLDVYHAIIETIGNKMQNKDLFIAHDTICRQVAFRDKQLRQFAENHDIVIFVSGKKSSNGKVLYDICKSTNERTFFVSEEIEIEKQWFNSTDSVGICGATSTPRWLMEQIYRYIDSTFK